MKQFRKVLLSVLALVLVSVLSIGATLAYLQFEDGAVNVMTVGKAVIKQHEYQRAEGVAYNAGEAGAGNGIKKGALVPFVQGQPLRPSVPANNHPTDYTAEASDLFFWGDYVYSGTAGNGLWNDNKLSNVMDKFVFVENTGAVDVYYRTVIAFECPVGMEYGEGSNKEFMMNVSGSSLFSWENVGYTNVDGTRYLLMVATYQNALKPGQTSHPSLLQVLMTNKVTNEHIDLLGNSYEILVMSQAVQTDGFKDAATALEAAFGPVTVDSNPWLGQSQSKAIVKVDSAEALADAVAAADGKDTTIILAPGAYTTNFEIEGGSNITLMGTKDVVLSGQIATTASNAGTLTLEGVTVNVDNTIVDSTGISQTSKSAIAIWGDQTVVCKNVTFNMSLESSTAITSWWDTGVGTTIECYNCVFNANGQRPIRATGNVTVENCVFNDPYRYAVQLTAKASTATLLSYATINFNNNVINAGDTSSKPVYGIQLEGSDYGCNDLVINGAGNKLNLGATGKDGTMYYCECGKVNHDTIAWNVESPAVHEGDPSSNVNMTVSANDINDVKDAIAAGHTNVVLTPGTYTFPSSSMKEGVTLECAEGTVFTGNTKLNIKGATVIGATFSNPTGNAVDQTINGIFKDCTFTGSNALRSCYAGETVVFENCVFNGDGIYGAHFDGGANDVIFKNCTFSGFNAMGSEITNLTLENCTFVANGKSNYNGINLWGSTNLINCTFIFDGTADYEWVDARGDNKTINLVGCVVIDANGVKKGVETVFGDYGSKNKVVIDGREMNIAANQEELERLIAEGATTVYLNDTGYDLNGIQKNGLTLIGADENVKVANTTKYASGKGTGAIWQAIALENVTVTNTVYTMADGGNATFTGVNFAAGFRQGYGKNVAFTGCIFGSNSEGYALHFQTDPASEGGNIILNGCEFEGGKVHLGGKRAYTFTGCDFAAGTDFQVWSNVTLDNCTVNGVVVTAANAATLFPNLDLTKVTFN